MKKKTIIQVILPIVVVLILGGFFFYRHGISAVSKNDKEVIVKMEKGMGALQMVNRLDEEGLIKNPLCAKIFLKLHSYDHLQANTYVFNETMSVKDMYDIMENPEFKYILKSKITIKEGNTIPEVAEEFSRLLKIKKDEVIKQWKDPQLLQSFIKDYWFIDESILNKNLMYPMEGYLYPETYFITEEKPTVESVTRLSLDMMSKILEPYKDEIQKRGWSMHQFLTFASVVERESLFDKDKPIIAGVFMNRLDQDMLLQSDITVNYAWQRTGVDVSYQHLKIDSLYNTYKYKGLPVGPISTVSRSTLESCVHYDKNDYLYFFAKKDGTVLYSRTLQEHNKTVKENKWY